MQQAAAAFGDTKLILKKRTFLCPRVISCNLHTIFEARNRYIVNAICCTISVEWVRPRCESENQNVT